MSGSLLTSPVARVVLRALGMAPLDRTFELRGSLAGLRRILFVDSGELSDLVFFLPVLDGIKQQWPDLELQVMVEERWADLFRREASVDALILYRPEQLRARSTGYYRLLREIQGRAFDGVILMAEERDPARDMVPYASQASLRVGVWQPEREGVLNCLLRWQGRGRYQIELAAEIGRIVGLRYDPLRWRFTLRPEELRAAEQLIHFRKPVRDQVLLGVDPGPGKASRRFAPDNLAYLVNHLIEKLRAKVMIFHLDQPAGEIEAFRRRLRGETLDMPEQKLRETLALASRCDLFVAGNTDLFHAAVAAGVPALGLFTEADGVRWEPRERADVAILRGRPGESMTLAQLDQAVERILHAGRS